MLHLLSSENYTIIPLDSVIADLSGKIRSETVLRLPDAVIMPESSEFRNSSTSSFWGSEAQQQM